MERRGGLEIRSWAMVRCLVVGRGAMRCDAPMVVVDGDAVCGMDMAWHAMVCRLPRSFQVVAGPPHRTEGGRWGKSWGQGQRSTRLDNDGSEAFKRGLNLYEFVVCVFGLFLKRCLPIMLRRT
jgi:hypothetical protein